MVQELERLRKEYEALISRKNEKCNKNNGVYVRYKYPVLTAEHAPLIWRYDFDEKTNPYMEERIGINATMNSGAIKLNGKYYLVVRVEGDDRKSFFAVAESDSPVDGFRFWDYPILAGFTVSFVPNAKIPMHVREICRQQLLRPELPGQKI